MSGAAVERLENRQVRPPAGLEGQFELDADYAIGKVLQLNRETFPGLDRHRLQVFDDRRALKAHIFGRRMLKGGLASGRLRTLNLAQLVEPDLLRHVVEHQHRKRSAKWLHSCILLPAWPSGCRLKMNFL